MKGNGEPMAIIVLTDEPRSLVAAIKASIDSGAIQTWSYDADGDFTHSAEQWNAKAWFTPVVGDDRVVFRIFPPVKTDMSVTVYAVYHGRFIEMLLRHFDGRFSVARATAQAAHGDVIRST